MTAAGVPVATRVSCPSAPTHTPAKRPCGVARNAARRPYRPIARCRAPPGFASASAGLASAMAVSPSGCFMSAAAPRRHAATGSSGARSKNALSGTYMPRQSTRPR